MARNVWESLIPVLAAGVVLGSLTACTLLGGGASTTSPSSAPREHASATVVPFLAKPSRTAGGGASRTVTPAPSAKTSHSAQSACPKGVTLPAGVSPSVCGGVPAQARDDPARTIETDGVYSFMTPSGNIICDWVGGFGADVDGLQCAIGQADFAPPPRPKNCDLDWQGSGIWLGQVAGKGICRGDVMNAQILQHSGSGLPALAYGVSIVHEQLVCSSAQDGLTCWNTKTQHGFKFSRSAQLTW